MEDEFVKALLTLSTSEFADSAACNRVNIIYLFICKQWKKLEMFYMKEENNIIIYDN